MLPALLALIVGLAIGVALIATGSHVLTARNHTGLWVWLSILGALVLAAEVHHRVWLYRWRRGR